MTTAGVPAARLSAATYAEHRELLGKDNIVIVEGSVAHDDYSGGLAMRARGVRSLLQARQDYASRLTIELHGDSLNDNLTDQLERTLAGSGGGNCPVSVVYLQARNKARVSLGERWQVVPSDELLQELRDQLGRERVSLEY